MFSDENNPTFSLLHPVSNDTDVCKFVHSKKNSTSFYLNFLQQIMLSIQHKSEKYHCVDSQK